MGTLSAKASSTKSNERTNKKYRKGISEALQQQHIRAPAGEVCMRTQNKGIDWHERSPQTLAKVYNNMYENVQESSTNAYDGLN